MSEPLTIPEWLVHKVGALVLENEALRAEIARLTAKLAEAEQQAETR